MPMDADVPLIPADSGSCPPCRSGVRSHPRATPAQSMANHADGAVQPSASKRSATCGSDAAPALLQAPSQT